MRRACAEGPARPAPRAARGGARGGARRRRHRAVVGGGRHPHPRHRAPVPAARHGPHRAAVPGAPSAVGRRPGRGRVRLGPGASAARRCRRAAAVRPVHLDGGRRRAVVGPDPPGAATPCSTPTPTCGSPCPGCAAPCAPSRATSPSRASPRRRSTRCSSATSRAAAGSRGAPRACRRPARPGATSAAPRWSAGTWTPCRASSGSTRPPRPRHRRQSTPPATSPPSTGPAEPPAAARHSTRRCCSTPTPGPAARRAAPCPIRPAAAASPGRPGTGSRRCPWRFDGWKGGPVIRSAGCWDRHAWNPRSDHPQGRACDLFATQTGPVRRRRRARRRLAHRALVPRPRRSLQVKYVIWQGRYWDPRVADQDGWGRRYSGGGVYDVRDATGRPLRPRPRQLPGVTRAPNTRRSRRLPLAVAVLLVLAGLVVRGDEPGPPLGAVLDGSDRHALDAAPLRRGPDPPPADPAVDLTDPAAVARAYLAAARSATPADHGRTRRDAVPYAAAGSPAAVGVVVLDPPPPGQVRTAAVHRARPRRRGGGRPAPRVPGHRRHVDRPRDHRRHDRVRGARPATGWALAGRRRRTRSPRGRRLMHPEPST